MVRAPLPDRAGSAQRRVSGFLDSFSSAEAASFHSLAGAFLLAFPALFSIVNPLGASLIFAEVTDGRSAAERNMLARRVAAYGLLILLVSLWIGSSLLAFFGITIGALRIAGGLVVAVRAWGLLQAPEANEAKKQNQASQQGRTTAAADVASTAFFPLTMPFTVGPGSISVAIALGAERPELGGLPARTGFYAGACLAAVLVCLVVWIAYAGAPRLVGLLGRSGARIVTRLVALILLCIGVQITVSGVQDVLVGALQRLPPVAAAATVAAPAR
ncbi:MAG: NAAT family transporter [Gluconacetobacter diazotrophicus]|nr:NAAT family transporter [Gluconacetobacter diazotrophicus]